MPLKTRKGFPPGGWSYFQPETGWRAPFPLVDDFGRTVDRIIEHRIANTRFSFSTDWNTVANQLDLFTCARLKQNEHYCDGVKKNYQPQPQPEYKSSGKAAGLAVVKSMAGGARILSDWLGEGGVPVDKELAQSRANTCLSCPNNTRGNFVVSKITKTIADTIRNQLKVKHDLSMTLEGEEKLETCKVCICNLRLKPWVPAKHLKEHTSQEVLNEFPDHCWVKKELL